MLRIIKRNIVFGLAFNIVAVVAGGTGLLSPIMGAVVHNAGSVLMVLSSASLAFASEGGHRS
jgi:Cd2+/Zn2+-exporting ATPase